MKSKFGKQDDVMLDREITALRRQIAKLTEWHSDLSERFFANINKIFDELEKIEKRLSILEQHHKNKIESMDNSEEEANAIIEREIAKNNI